MSIIVAIFTPLAQDPQYHVFADTRTLHQIPNFWNVISNIPFFLAALYGLKVLRSRFAFIEPWERFAFGTLLAGTAAVCVGSTYYHLQPDDAHLFWDRLPMTVGFMSLLATTIGERINSKAGKQLLLPLILLGLASVVQWRVTGDLKMYCLVQFGTMLAMPLALAKFPPRYSGSSKVWGTVILYILAKILELMDHQIASILTTGGHPWKHLAAAGAVFVYINAVSNRQPIQCSAEQGDGARESTPE